jgi:type III secretory pathway lipoprotein EscJ
MRRVGIPSLGLFLLSLACVIGVTGCGQGKDSLVSVDSEKEANRVLVALEEHGISGAEKVSTVRQRKTYFEILVPPDRLYEARRLLLQLDIPHESQQGFEGMLKSSGLIPTKTDERARLMHAMAGELSRTLEAIGRVVQARVHVVLPETDPLASASSFKDATAKPTAAVLIKYVSSLTGNPGMPTRAFAAGGEIQDPSDNYEEGHGAEFTDLPISSTDVKKMVAGSVEGLEEQNVTVVFAPVPRQFAAPTDMVPEDPTPSSADAAAAQTGGGLGFVKAEWVQYGLFGTTGILALLVIFLIMRLRQVSSAASDQI